MSYHANTHRNSPGSVRISVSRICLSAGSGGDCQNARKSASHSTNFLRCGFAFPGMFRRRSPFTIGA